MCICNANSETYEKSEEISVEERRQVPVDYETAVAATGYGLFNILMLLAALPIAWTCICDTTTIAFIIRVPEYQFELTTLRRGIASSITYLGMIIVGPLWDFLLQDCITGYVGKRNVMIVGILLDAICNLLRAHATSYYVFIFLKFVSGVLIAGPLSMLMAYLAEFHAPVYQPHFTRWAGLLVMVSNLIPPALAATLVLLVPGFTFTFNNYFYPLGRVYLLICSILPVLGLVFVSLMPKTPKFLMAQGKNDEALRILRIMYTLNKFKPGHEYPYKVLAQQSQKQKTLNIVYQDKIKDSISELKTLFSGPHLRTISIIMFLQFGSMVGFNVMRLWLPPFLLMINHFQVIFRSIYYPVDEYLSMCDMLFPRIRNIDFVHFNQTMPSLEATVYINSTITGSSAIMFGFLFSVFAVTRKLKISVIVITFFIATIGCMGANWAVEIPYILVLLASVIVTCRIAGNIISAYNTEVMPQMLRPTAIKVINFIGNFGAAGGNLLFSVILSVDCLSAFISLGCTALVCIIVTMFLVKQPEKTIVQDVEK